jgi:hypothetical protein
MLLGQRPQPYTPEFDPLANGFQSKLHLKLMSHPSRQQEKLSLISILSCQVPFLPNSLTQSEQAVPLCFIIQVDEKTAPWIHCVYRK